MRASRKSAPRHPRAGGDLPLSRRREISAAKLSLLPSHSRRHAVISAQRRGELGCTSQGWLPSARLSALGEFREMV